MPSVLNIEQEWLNLNMNIKTQNSHHTLHGASHSEAA
jgi:hypothetical protein